MNKNTSGNFDLSDEHRMLLRMRDTLYEGSWEDFTRDLRARANHEPHVFETIPETPGLDQTIRHHLDLIAAMKTWEDEHRQVLGAG